MATKNCLLVSVWPRNYACAALTQCAGKQFLAGFGAGVIEAVVAVTPMESIKTFAIEKNLGLVSAVRGIVQTSGIGGLYKGVMPTVAKQVVMCLYIVLHV